MKVFLRITLLTLMCLMCGVQKSEAEAWPNNYKQFKNTFSSYYAAPPPSYLQTILTDNTTFQDATLRIKKRFSRLSGTAELAYGLTRRTTLYAKVDAGYVNETFKSRLVRNGVAQNFEVNLDYMSVDPTFSILRQIKRTKYSVYSVQAKLYPGQFISSRHKNMYNKKMAAYELELLIGNAFEANFRKISKLLGVQRKSRWHYRELRASAKHYPRLGQLQFDVDAEVGIRPTNRILVLFGLKATWNGATFARRPFDERDIQSYAANTSLNAEQMNQLIGVYRALGQERSRYTDYQMSYKISRKIAKETDLSLQWLSNFIKGKPLKNNVVVLSYETKF